jgi:pyruvate/2-oxoglutarate dehydrogenase complex dihydrolipoamide dehydrogenase (E3) component
LPYAHPVHDAAAGHRRLTETEALRAGYEIKVSRENVADIIAMPRAYTAEETRGVMKFIVDAESGLILGAALLSIDAQKVIHTSGADDPVHE